MKDFAHRFAELRKDNGYTQEGIATALKVSRSIIGMYESGKRVPSFESMEIIADFFNADLDYLMGRSDIKNRYREEVEHIFLIKEGENAPSPQSDPMVAEFEKLLTQLSPENKAKVKELAQLLLMDEKYHKERHGNNYIIH